MIFNLKEVKEELEPKKPEIVYEIWKEGVPEVDGVIYLKLEKNKYNGEIDLICVNSEGSLLSLGKLIKINKNHGLTRYLNINDFLGFNLDNDGKLQISN